MAETWKAKAACRGAVRRTGGYALFFSGETGGPQPGKKMCATCPVPTECLVYAEKEELTFGTFGGLDQEERRLFLNRYGSCTTPDGRRAHARVLETLRS